MKLRNQLLKRTSRPKKSYPRLKLWRSGESAKVAVLREEYKSAKFDKWTTDRLHASSMLFGCHLSELLAWAGLFDKNLITRYKNANAWPMSVTIPIYNLERFKIGQRSPNKQELMSVKFFNLDHDDPAIERFLKENPILRPVDK